MTACATPSEGCHEDAVSCADEGTAIFFPDPRVGTVLGERYRLLERIAEGGMGTVYRAEHVVLHKRVAVKMLRPAYRLDPALVYRFRQEAIAASEIGQENVVDITDFGRTLEGSLYFVMEELDGVSLAALLAATGPMPVGRAALILAQVCRAFAAAHARGIIHRDLRPDNVVVLQRDDGSDFVKVVDFGISQRFEEESDAGFGTGWPGYVLGAPDYMSPELIAGGEVDHRADIYAFGVLAYELLTGTLPFRGETGLAAMLEHRHGAPVPPSHHRPGLPPALEALILHALQGEPAARQQSMAEVAEGLTSALAELGLPPVYDRSPRPSAGLAPARGFTDRPGVEVLAPHRSPPRRGAPAAGAAPTCCDTTDAVAAAGVTSRGTAPRRRGWAAALTVAALAVSIWGYLAWRGSAGTAPRSVEPAAPTAAVAASTTGAPPAPAVARGAAVAAAPRGVARGTVAGAAARSTAPAASRAAPPRAQGTVASAPGAAKRARRTDHGRKKLAERPADDDLYSRLDELKPDPF